MKVRSKLLLLMLLPVFLGGLLTRYFASAIICRTLHGQAVRNAALAAQRAADDFAPAFRAGSEKLLLPALFAIKKQIGAADMAFAATDGTILAHTDVAMKGRPLRLAASRQAGDGIAYTEPGHHPDGSITFTVPIFDPASGDREELALGSAEKRRLGTLSAGLPIAVTAAAEAEISRGMLLLLAAVCAVILAGVFFASELALRPVRLLLEGTRLIRSGRFGAQLPITSSDEFGDLAASFNSMSETLEGTIVSKDYLDAVIENLSEMLLVTDLEGRITRANRAALVALRKADKELLGRPLSSLFGCEAGRGWFAALTRDGEVRNLETTLLSSPRLPVRLTASYIKDTVGHRSGAVILVRDITLTKKYEAELARSNEDLQRFAFVASHDLQEPLRTLSNYIQLLEHKYREKLGSGAEREIEFIMSALARMRSLVRDLLDYSRINPEKSSGPTDTAASVDVVLKQLGKAVSETGAMVETGALPAVAADRLHVERLFQNLVSNSLKFSGGRQPKVRITAESGPERCVFKVEDNGEGIDQKYAQKLFKLFGRLHGPTVPGSGIGLAACRKIVEVYGGEIWFRSEPGKGAAFYFTLPAVKA